MASRLHAAIGTRTFQAVLVLLLLAHRLAPVVSDPRSRVMPYADERGYLVLARNLLDGNGYSLAVHPPHVPSTVRVPGYPLFLVGLHLVGFRSLHELTVAQAILDTLTGLLLALAARRLAGASAGALALLAWIVLAPGSGIVRDLYTEVFAIFLSGLATCALASLGPAPGRRRVVLAAAAGLALAALTLTRPAQLVWLPVGAAVTWLAARRWREPLAFGAAAALPIAAWLIRNLVVTGRPVLTTLSLGMNFWLGTVSGGVPPTRWVEDPQARDGGRFVLEYPLADSDEEMDRVQRLWNDYFAASYLKIPPEAGERADRDLLDLGVERWRRQPWRCLALRAENLARAIDQPERVVGRAAAIVAWLGGVAGALALRRRRALLAWIVGAPLVLLAAHAPLYTEPRYLYPAYPMLVLSLACGLTSLTDRAGRATANGVQASPWAGAN